MMGADSTIAAARLVWGLDRAGPTGALYRARSLQRPAVAPFPHVARLRDAMNALEERGYVEVIELSRDGPDRPPSPTVRVQPEIARAWR